MKRLVIRIGSISHAMEKTTARTRIKQRLQLIRSTLVDYLLH